MEQAHDRLMKIVGRLADVVEQRSGLKFAGYADRLVLLSFFASATLLVCTLVWLALARLCRRRRRQRTSVSVGAPQRVIADPTSSYHARRAALEQPDAALDVQSALAHCGTLIDGGPVFGEITAPLHLSTTFRRGDSGQWERGYAYGRHHNPTRDLFERAMNRLESGCGSAAFSSGMAAIHAAIFGLVKAGERVLVSDDVYKGVRHLLDMLTQQGCLSYSVVDLTDAAATRRALLDGDDVALIWLEVVSNPRFKVVDPAAIGELLDELQLRRRPLIVVDSTWTTPVLIRPLVDCAADVVVHSCTKFIGGHSDLLGGVVVCKQPAALQSVRRVQTTVGSVMSPFECYLAARSLRTLYVRVKRQSKSAMKVARFLSDHRAVTAVHYPGLARHPQHAVAARLLPHGLYGGMLAFEIVGGLPDAIRLIAQLRVFTKSTSLGATESLVEPSAGLSGGENLPQSLIRLSVGLENPRVLIQDLGEAFTRAAQDS